jgi:hypothetical protein
MNEIANSAFFSVILGGVLTILSTVLAWALLHFNQRRVDRDRTRRAIIHEVNHIADNIIKLIDIESGEIVQEDVDRVIVTLSTDVLNEDLLQINKLTSPEVKNIYEFYEATRVLESKIQDWEDGNGSQAAIKTAAERVLTNRNEIHQTVKRSRISLFTEWYKQRDREQRSN